MGRLLFVVFLCAVIYIACNNRDSEKEDKEQQRSINREIQLRDDGMDEAANIERDLRRDYLRGGGYTSPDGGRQVHYQGSREQQEMLDLIDSYNW
ncbi:MAG: hypothetical protein IKJ67_01670 [Bacteroidales bacterium]|nr:hypothetical protein [Bacteroidales bacterium]